MFNLCFAGTLKAGERERVRLFGGIQGLCVKASVPGPPRGLGYIYISDNAQAPEPSSDFSVFSVSQHQNLNRNKAYAVVSLTPKPQVV